LLLFQNDEPPEITYCVVDQTGTLSLQALTPTQPMPAEEELNDKFAELVVSITSVSMKILGCTLPCSVIILTDSFEQSLSWDANGRSDNKTVHIVYVTQKFTVFALARHWSSSQPIWIPCLHRSIL